MAVFSSLSSITLYNRQLPGNDVGKTFRIDNSSSYVRLSKLGIDATNLFSIGLIPSRYLTYFADILAILFNCFFSNMMYFL